MPVGIYATEAQIIKYIGENYGADLAGFMAIPEIRNLLVEAARNDYTEMLVQSKFRATTWFRSRSKTMKAYDGLKITEPEEAARLVQQKTAELEPIMAQLGLSQASIMPYPRGSVGDQAARKLAENAVRFGWTEQEITGHFAYSLTVQSQKQGLTQQSAPDLQADSFVTMARNEFFVPLDQSTAEGFAIDILAGRKTEDQVKAYLARLASARFPGLSESGFTPGEYMAPIRNTIAETLELQPADVDLLDRRFSAVLEHQGGDGKLRPMTVSESQQWARSQSAYRTTKGARDEVAMFSQNLGEMFGKVG